MSMDLVQCSDDRCLTPMLFDDRHLQTPALGFTSRLRIWLWAINTFPFRSRDKWTRRESSCWKYWGQWGHKRTEEIKTYEYFNFTGGLLLSNERSQDTAPQYHALSNQWIMLWRLYLTVYKLNSLITLSRVILYICHSTDRWCSN